MERRRRSQHMVALIKGLQYSLERIRVEMTFRKARKLDQPVSNKDPEEAKSLYLIKRIKLKIK